MRPLSSTAAVVLTAFGLGALALSCFKAPRIDTFTLVPASGPPGAAVRVRIAATDPSGGSLSVWAEATNPATGKMLEVVNCPAVPDSDGVYAGSWIADTAGLGQPSHIDFEAFARNRAEQRGGRTCTFDFQY